MLVDSFEYVNELIYNWWVLLGGNIYFIYISPYCMFLGANSGPYWINTVTLSFIWYGETTFWFHGILDYKMFEYYAIIPENGLAIYYK